MTVSSSVRQVTYLEDGVSTLFTVPFRFDAAGDLRVARRSPAGIETLLVANVDYSVAGAGAPSGGTLTRTAAGAGQRLTIKRVVARTQLVDYTPFDPFPAETQERIADKLTMIVQEDADNFARAVVVPDGEAGFTLQPVAVRTGYAGWLGGALVGVTLPAGLTAQQTITVPDRAALAALPGPVVGQAIFLSEAGREGWFKTFPGTAPAVGDILQGLYVQSAAGSFYYARLWDRVTALPEWFGVVPNGPDCLGAMTLATALAPELQCANDDYYFSDTFVQANSQRTIRGVPGRSQSRGQGTSFIVQSAVADVVYIGLPAFPAGGINAFLKDSTISGLTLRRTVAPSMASASPPLGPTGLRCKYVLSIRASNIFSAENAVGFYYGANVYAKFTNCKAFRVSQGTGAVDYFVGHYADGSVSFGAAGGNASLYLFDCSTEFAGSYDVTGQTVDGLACNLAFVDTFVREFETSKCNRGVIVVGTGAGGGKASNIDFHIDHAVLDTCRVRGVEVSAIAPGGIVTIRDTYVALDSNATAFAAFHVHDGAGEVTIAGGQSICFPNSDLGGNALGVFAQNQTGFSLTKHTVRESRRPVALVNCSNFEVEATVSNFTHTPTQAPFYFDGCSNGRIEPSTVANGAAFTAGVEFVTSATRITVFQERIVDATIGGGAANRVKYLGASVPATGTFGGTNELYGA